jgi:hypothetical protein
MQRLEFFVRALLLTLTIAILVAGVANAANVRITKLTDVSLLSLNPLANASSSENICVFSASPTKGYNVTATGSGAGSAFTLSGGGSLPVLPYSVQWNQQPGQTSGTTLSQSVPLTGQITTATTQQCTGGPATTASLIVSLASSDLQGASTGITYTGVLTLVIAAE